MDLNPGQLDALVAIADHGSFDAAARRLHITPSAISQRIRALEAAAGQVLISRGTPCRPTPHGQWLIRLGRQTRLLHDEASQALTAAGAVELPVSVNADSLAAWFRDVLAEVATWDGTAIRLRVEDEGHSQELLRSGDVLAAVTSDQAAVQGCTTQLLGALRYVPAAAPWFADRWRRGHSPDWSAMPAVFFNDKDDLQRDLLRLRGSEQAPPIVHQVPSSADFYEAVRIGLGWGMLPEPQASADLAAGRLVRLSADVVDVPLYWQRWRLDSPRLTALTDAVRTAADRYLLRGLRRGRPVDGPFGSEFAFPARSIRSRIPVAFQNLRDVKSRRLPDRVRTPPAEACAAQSPGQLGRSPVPGDHADEDRHDHDDDQDYDGHDTLPESESLTREASVTAASRISAGTAARVRSNNARIRFPAIRA